MTTTQTEELDFYEDETKRGATIIDTDGNTWQLVTHTAKTALLRSLDNHNSYALALKYQGIGDNLGAMLELMYGVVERFKANIKIAFNRFDTFTNKQGA